MASSSTSPPQSHPPMDSPPLTLALPAPSPASGSSLRPTVGSKPQKSPPVPWSHQETLALIQAYQEKWYSLKKGQLKAFQWEEVTASVSALCGFDEPSKTSTQCRHKIEKLRKRYKAELQKPYPDSWQYFELMDHLERGPGPLNVRPVAVFKSSPGTSDRNTSNNVNPRYASVYSASLDYHHNNSSRDDESDESDEEWNASGYGVEASKRNNKSKSINNIVHGSVRSGVGSGKRGSSGENDRFMGVLRNKMNGKGRYFYGEVDSEEDEEGDDLVEEKETFEEAEGDDDDGEGRKLAAEIRGFADSFMKMENKKIGMIRETERCRMEMEKKRMEMILGAQRKIIDTIGRAFGTTKKPRMA